MANLLRRRATTGTASGIGSTESASWNTRNVRTIGTFDATRSTTGAKHLIRIAKRPPEWAKCPMRFANESITPATTQATAVTSRVMENANRYTDSAKIESGRYTIE
jgi:hypothetical protein